MEGRNTVGVVKPQVLTYLGCNADASHPDGIYVLSVDRKTGGIVKVESYAVPHAVYLCGSPDGSILYSCSDTGIASFAVDGAQLVSVDAVSTAAGPCHVSATRDGQRVVWAEYFGGTCGSVEVSGGRFGEVVIHQHSGKGVNLPRQAGPHCHQAVPLPDGSGYAVCDLGLDEIVEYPSGRVFKTTPAGTGPRHLAFHSNGRLAFLVSELGNIVSSLSWSRADGFRILDTISTIFSHRDAEAQSVSKNLCVSAAQREKNSINHVSQNLAAAIRFTPDGKRVVVSNRGENSLVSYDFDEATGKVAFKARTLLEGDWPRDFAFVDESLALVAYERSGEVHSLRYDYESGRFKTLAKIGGFFRPLALLPKDEVQKP